VKGETRTTESILGRRLTVWPPLRMLRPSSAVRSTCTDSACPSHGEQPSLSSLSELQLTAAMPWPAVIRLHFLPILPIFPPFQGSSRGRRGWLAGFMFLNLPNPEQDSIRNGGNGKTNLSLRALEGTSLCDSPGGLLVSTGSLLALRGSAGRRSGMSTLLQRPLFWSIASPAHH
jgi:hypothetical protein